MGFLSSGDGARFVALRAAPLAERFAALPRRMSVAAWTTLVEAAGEDPAYGLSEEVVARNGDDVILDQRAADIVAHACLETCGAERWRGQYCSNDLGRIFEGLRLPDLDDAKRAAWSLLRTTLAPSGAVEPWWLTARFSGNCSYGWLDPPRLAALARAIESTAIADEAAVALLNEPQLPSYAPDDLLLLGAFVVRAAARGDWVLGVEWR